MKEKNKTYTAADFARYHAGTMPADEMHELEKAALEDPFLEDALEGYVHAPAFETDIEELQRRLAEKRKKKNVPFITSITQNKWWRIAALFVVMAGAGYFFYRVNYLNEKKPLAKNDIKDLREKTDNAVTFKKSSEPTSTDSVSKEKDIAFENQLVPTSTQNSKATLPAAKRRIKKQIVVSSRTAEPSAGRFLAVQPKEQVHPDSTNPERINQERFERINQEKVSIQEKKDIQQEVTTYVLKGKLTDGKGSPVPYASITDKGRDRATVTDTAGLFSIMSRDSSITAMASAPGYESTSFMLKKDAYPTIAMNKTSTELNEVVVVGFSKHKRSHKKDSGNNYFLSGKAPGVQVGTAGTPPSGSQEKFDEYLKKNTPAIFNDNNERLTGEVLLSFKINKKGRPENIKVLKSSCEPCEKEAIELLENGPRWTGKKNRTETVAIKF